MLFQGNKDALQLIWLSVGFLTLHGAALLLFNPVKTGFSRKGLPDTGKPLFLQLGTTRLPARYIGFYQPELFHRLFSFTKTSLPLKTTANFFIFSIPLSMSSVSYFFSSICARAASTAVSRVSLSSVSTVLNSTT
jgi:hypothetical protein